MQIVGVSFDSPEENEAWAQDEGFAFELWTDDERSLALHYGAASSESAAFAQRITVLLDENGDLLLVYDVGGGIATHPGKVLEDCEALFGGR